MLVIAFANDRLFSEGVKSQPEASQHCELMLGEPSCLSAVANIGRVECSIQGRDDAGRWPVLPRLLTKQGQQQLKQWGRRSVLP